MSKRIVWVVIIFGLLFAAGAIPRYLSHKKLMAGDEQKALDAPIVIPRRLSGGNLTLPANLEPFEEAAVVARTNGVVVHRYVDIGSKVRRGQVLAEIDAPDLDHQTDQAYADVARATAADEQARAGIADSQAQVAHATAAVRKSQANVANAIANLRRAERGVITQQSQVNTAKSKLDFAQVTYRRWAALLKDGAVPPQDVDDRRAAYDQAKAQWAAAISTTNEARAQLEAARASVDAAKEDLRASMADETSAIEHVQAAVAVENASFASHRASQSNAERYNSLKGFERVKAGFDGVVTVRNIDVGSYVAPGSPANGLFHISRSDVLRIRVQIPESYTGSIKDGMPASIVVPQYPERKFDGKVFLLSGALNGDTRTRQVEVKVDNSAGVLIAGMYGQVNFEIGSKSPLRIPAASVMMTSKGPMVAVVDDKNTVHYQVVDLGDDLGTEIEINKGLDPNAHILANPSYSITDGVVVNPVTPTPTPSASGSAAPPPPGGATPAATPPK